MLSRGEPFQSKRAVWAKLFWTHQRAAWGKDQTSSRYIRSDSKGLSWKMVLIVSL